METISLEDLKLKYGSHQSPSSGMCIMEASAYFAGEKHSDTPECVDPVIAAFLRGLNDRLGDEKRQLLKPFVLKVIGTRGTTEHEEIRRVMLSNFALREVAIRRADAAGLVELSSKLRAVPEVTAHNLAEVKQQLRAIRDDAWNIRAQKCNELAAILKPKIEAELAKQAKPVAAAVADAAAAAVADAAAAAVADAVAVAVADAAAAADAAADAAAVAAAVADAVAAAAAAADAAAVAAADADAAAVAVAFWRWGSGWSKVYNSVYAKMRPIYRERYEKLNIHALPAALELLDKLIAVHKVDRPIVRGVA
jgi:hypothetical protein